MRATGKWLIRSPGWVWIVAWIATLASPVALALPDAPLWARLTWWILNSLLATAVLAVLVRFIIRSVRARSVQRIRPRDAMVVTVAFFGLLVFVSAATPTEEEQIAEVIERAATESGPVTCDEYASERYLVQITGVESWLADDACATSSATAEDVTISIREREDDWAEVLVTYEGGFLDGSSVLKELVETDGGWKIDRNVEVVRLDRESFDRTFRAEHEKFGLSADGLTCAVAKERRLSNDEVEELIVGPASGFFAETVVRCDPEAVEEYLIEGLRYPIAAYGAVPPPIADCAAAEIRAASDAELKVLYVDLAAYNKLLYECDPGEYLVYLGDGLRAQGREDEATACVIEELRGIAPEDLDRAVYDDEQFTALIDDCD